jgi:hypothetical protein
MECGQWAWTAKILNHTIGGAFHTKAGCLEKAKELNLEVIA